MEFGEHCQTMGSLKDEFASEMGAEAAWHVVMTHGWALSDWGG